MRAGDGGGWGKGGGGNEGLGFASGSAADKTILRLIINLTPSDRMTLKLQGPLKGRQK